MIGVTCKARDWNAKDVENFGMENLKEKKIRERPSTEDNIKIDF